MAITDGWGSGYPSDARCSTWMKQNIDPIFGWSNECRLSWAPAKDMLEAKTGGTKVDWPVEDEESVQISNYFQAGNSDDAKGNELSSWFGTRVSEEVF